MLAASTSAALGTALRGLATQLPTTVSTCLCYSRAFHETGATPAAPAPPTTLPTAAAAAQHFAAQAKTARVTVNGRKIEVPEGVPILEAASRLGIFVPTLCNHPRLPLHPGTCRLCLVEEGGRLRPACATPVTDGMRVETDTAAVKESIHSVLALLRVRARGNTQPFFFLPAVARWG